MIDTTRLEERLTALLDRDPSDPEIPALLTALNAAQDHQLKSAQLTGAVREARQKSWQTTASVLVPFLSIFTLAVTIYFQWDQARLSAVVNEDARWRVVVDAMTKPPTPTSDIVILTALDPFFESSRYQHQAYEIAFLLAARTSSEFGFEALYRTAWGSAGWGNLKDMRRLDQSLAKAYADMDALFESFGGLKVLERQKELPRRPISSATATIDIGFANTARGEVLESMRFLSGRVADVLRSDRPASTERVDLSGFHFFETDLHDIDFTNVDIARADLQRPIVDGAKLTPSSFIDSNWSGVQWWKAKAVSGPLVQYLLSRGFFPKFDASDGETYPNAKLDEVDVKGSVQRLCAAAHVACTFPVDVTVPQTPTAPPS